MIVRYRYRAYPTAAQAGMLARTFGCARVVFNDALRLRDAAHEAGEKSSGTEVQRRVVTLAKRTPGREWLGEVASVGEKAEYYGRTFHRIGRFVPSSQVCSECGVKDGPKPLSVRSWTCGACGAVHDRDVNAARNILAAGQADRLNACRGGVRPAGTLATPGEAGTRRGAA